MENEELNNFICEARAEIARRTADKDCELSKLRVSKNEFMFWLFCEPSALRHYKYEGHKRGRNWASILRGKNSVAVEFESMPMKSRVFDCSALKIGDAFEIGGDYISGGGNRTPDRAFFVVLKILEDGILVKEFATRAQAMKNRFEPAK